MATAKKSSIFWSQDITQKVAATTLDIMEADRRLTAGQAAVQAQEKILPEAKWKSVHYLRYKVEDIIGKEMEAELTRRNATKKKEDGQRMLLAAAEETRKEQERLATLEKESNVVQTKISTPTVNAETPAVFSVVHEIPTVDMEIDKLIDVLTSNIVGKVVTDFKAALSIKLRKGISTSYREVLLNEITNGMAPLYKITSTTPVAPPPAPGPVPMQVLNLKETEKSLNENGSLNGSHKPNEKVEVPEFGRVKVVLVGNAPADDDYFLRLKTPELLDHYEFVRVKKPGDMHAHRDAKVIVLANSKEDPTTMAARAIVPNATIVQGKASSTIKGWLETQYKAFQIGMVQSTIQ